MSFGSAFITPNDCSRQHRSWCGQFSRPWTSGKQDLSVKTHVKQNLGVLVSSRLPGVIYHQPLQKTKPTFLVSYSSILSASAPHSILGCLLFSRTGQISMSDNLLVTLQWLNIVEGNLPVTPEFNPVWLMSKLIWWNNHLIGRGSSADWTQTGIREG